MVQNNSFSSSILNKMLRFYPCHAEYFMYYTPTQHSSYKHVFSIRVENIVDPDQMASSEAS